MSEELSVAEINNLWEKVSARMQVGEPAQEPIPAVQYADPLIEMQRVEGEMATRYEKLKRRLNCKKASELAQKLYDGQIALVKRISAMLFLRSGKKPLICRTEKTSMELMDMLREYALWELRQAEAYKKYGCSMEPSLRDILFDAQKRKEENARLLGGIVEELIIQ